MAEQTKIRFYKYVTPPKTRGATISVGNKTIQGDSFSTTIKAVNSLGATVNSIAVALNKQAKANARIQKDQARKAGLARDRAREANIERKGSTTTKGVAQASEAAVDSLMVCWVHWANLLSLQHSNGWVILKTPRELKIPLKNLRSFGTGL